jgi:hypothetical protein
MVGMLWVGDQLGTEADETMADGVDQHRLGGPLSAPMTPGM